MKLLKPVVGINIYRHKSTTFDNNTCFVCDRCDKKYRHVSGLSRHKKKCNVKVNNGDNKDDLCKKWRH